MLPLLFIKCTIGPNNRLFVGNTYTYPTPVSLYIHHKSSCMTHIYNLLTFGNRIKFFFLLSMLCGCGTLWSQLVLNKPIETSVNLNSYAAIANTGQEVSTYDAFTKRYEDLQFASLEGTKVTLVLPMTIIGSLLRSRTTRTRFWTIILKPHDRSLTKWIYMWWIKKAR